MADSVLKSLWETHYVDRRVRQALQGMFESADAGLTRLIRRRVAELTPRQVVESLRRLDVRIESPSPVPEAGGPPAGPAPKRPRAGRLLRRTGKKHFGIKLTDLISAGLLAPPLKLFRKYRGQIMESTLLPDGGVEFQGVNYDSCSTAAEVARSTITGRRMSTNGWDFWQCLDADGKKRTLEAVRDQFLSMKGEGG
jgi:hypothetical protein